MNFMQINQIVGGKAECSVFATNGHSRQSPNVHGFRQVRHNFTSHYSRAMASCWGAEGKGGGEGSAGPTIHWARGRVVKF